MRLEIAHEVSEEIAHEVSKEIALEVSEEIVLQRLARRLSFRG